MEFGRKKVGLSFAWRRSKRAYSERINNVGYLNQKPPCGGGWVREWRLLDFALRIITICGHPTLSLKSDLFLKHLLRELRIGPALGFFHDNTQEDLERLELAVLDFGDDVRIMSHDSFDHRRERVRILHLAEVPVFHDLGRILAEQEHIS